MDDYLAIRKTLDDIIHCTIVDNITLSCIRHRDTIIFDFDDTLYPTTVGLFDSFSLDYYLTTLFSKLLEDYEIIIVSNSSYGGIVDKLRNLPYFETILINYNIGVYCTYNEITIQGIPPCRWKMEPFSLLCVNLLEYNVYCIGDQISDSECFEKKFKIPSREKKISSFALVSIPNSTEDIINNLNTALQILLKA